MNKHTKKFLIALIPGSFVLGLTGCDLAPDSGVWRGTAVFRDEFYGPTSCNFKLDVTHTDEALNVQKLESNCAHFRSAWDAISFEKHGDQLWKNGRQVGRAIDTGSATFELDMPFFGDPYSQPARRVIVSWTKVGNDLEFTEEAYFDGRTQRTHAWLRKESGIDTSGSISWD